MGKNTGDSVGIFSTRFSLRSFLKCAEKLTDSQKDSINKTAFGNLLLIQRQMVSKTLLVELMERWDHKKCAFVFPSGEITISLLDVMLILGLPVTGNPVILRDDTPFLDLERAYGAFPLRRTITVASLEQRLDSLAETNNEDFVRSFLLYMFGTFLFPNTNSKVDSRYLYLLRDIDKVNSFAWGAAILADVLYWLCRRTQKKSQYVGGCLIFLQIWFFEHIDIARPRLLNYRSKLPRVCNWRSMKSHRREWFDTKFKELKSDQIIWILQPTSDESKSDAIKELIEAEKRTLADLKTRSSVDTSRPIDHPVTSGYESMDHLIIDLEAESESESNRPLASGMQNLSSDAVSVRGTVAESESNRRSLASGMQNLSSDAVSVRETVAESESNRSVASGMQNLSSDAVSVRETVAESESNRPLASGMQNLSSDAVSVHETVAESESNRPLASGMQNLSSDAVSVRETVAGSSACHYLDKEKEPTERSQTSGANVVIVISSDDDCEDDLQKKSQTLEEQIVHLKYEIGDLTIKNKTLEDQLSLSLKFEEQNKKLMDEIETLQQENQELSASTNRIVTGLQKIVFDDITDAWDDGEQSLKQI